MNDLSLITQSMKTVMLRVSLLDDADTELEQLEGQLIELNLTVDGDSDIRRVSTLVMHVDESEPLAANFFGVWMDRKVQLYYGIVDTARNETQWWLLGTFLFSASSYSFDASSRQLSMSLVDLMATMTQERGSQIGYGVSYPADSSIADALEVTIARFSPYKDCDICEFEDVIPYDIEETMGSYPIALLKSLVSLYPWYEHYYSKEGVYTVRRLPTTLAEEAVMTAEDMNQIVISENGDVTYSDVKNCTEIWGKEIDPNYMAIGCSSQSGIYTLTMSGTFETYEYGALIAFAPNVACVAGQKLRVETLDAYTIYVEDGSGQQRSLNAGELTADVNYVVKYVDGKFILQGEMLIHVMCMEYNERPSESKIIGLKSFHNCENIQFTIVPNSPYACDRIGIVKQVLSEGEYQNIYTTQLAYERASYENWKATRLQDDITLETLFVPWLDVNQKVEYKSIATGETHQYLIRKIQVNPQSGTMSLSLARFYSLYPWMDWGAENDNVSALCGQFLCGEVACGTETAS